MKIESAAFQHGKPIPQKFTCQGEGVSPELFFHNVPKNTQSLVLIVDDPDAPSGTFDHWIAWNIPAESKGLAEDTLHLQHQGKNGYGKLGYKGPCPPAGNAHRYFFKLYALDTNLSLSEGSSKTKVEDACEGHILAMAELIGTYQRQ
ncbi:MAG TPA: YbhB/YbcL family Raf kinase inhibitor-like protein [Parachlamydiaceae bacterium]|nr:YbhB/YbcL family Raf kinase inhibitor-like protein [Parachlamydiaceae bacterium]